MHYLLTFFIVLFCSTGLLSAQTVFGKWKTIDETTGKAKAIIEIYEEDGIVNGKIIELINPKKPNPVCKECTGEDKDRPILGMQFIRGLEKDGDEYNGGKLLDPINGKLYKCYITLEDKETLKVRGYIGISLFGRTQYWERVK